MIVSIVPDQKNDLRNRILNLSRERFWESGFSKVTMDELAYELGISKKTLYIHFPSKKELFREALLSNLRNLESGLKDILENPETEFPEKLREILLFLQEKMHKPGRIFFRDMQRYAGDVWSEIERERTRILKEQFGRFLDTGTEKGILRPGIEGSVLLTALLSLVQQMINPEVLAQTSKTLAQAIEEVFEILFLGILTEEGRKAYHKTKAGGENEAPF
jgi:AcrR family transcriptional regulator